MNKDISYIDNEYTTELCNICNIVGRNTVYSNL